MILDEISNKEKWEEFIKYKIEVQHLSKSDEKKYTAFINDECFIWLYDNLQKGNFPSELPEKHLINKIFSTKKRVVYSYNFNDNMLLKYIAWNLYRYDSFFSNNCYAFRRNHGVSDAIKKIKNTKCIDKMFCLKADIHNYFNSIDINILLDKLSFIKNDDISLYNLFDNILSNELVKYSNSIIRDNHGAMAGTPTSPFFANVYLAELDRYFENNNILYFRYSDDILIFAENMNTLQHYQNILYEYLNNMHLTINPDKLSIYEPGDTIEFLGFSYNNGTIDISSSTITKTKSKIKRKADALRRWARKKNLPPEKAAIGFIRSMNYKFFGDDASSYENNDFTWSRWFFPNITTDTSLKVLDSYMQEYIRYIFTGRHYKGNYRITYNKLKELGYKSLVNEFYK